MPTDRQHFVFVVNVKLYVAVSAVTVPRVSTTFTQPTQSLPSTGQSNRANLNQSMKRQGGARREQSESENTTRFE